MSNVIFVLVEILVDTPPSTVPLTTAESPQPPTPHRVNNQVSFPIPPTWDGISHLSYQGPRAALAQVFSGFQESARFVDTIHQLSIDMDVDIFFVKLISIARLLDEEEKRGIAENLSEEELALFDLLTGPNIKLSKKEHEQFKKVAKELLDTLKAERLVLDWRKGQKTRAAIRVAIFDALEQLPELYINQLYDQRYELVYQHVYEMYLRGSQNLYT